MKTPKTYLILAVAALIAAALLTTPSSAAPTDKTLVSWFCFDEKTPDHCSVITLQTADRYDALAFGHDAPGKWSIASDENTRTQSVEQLARNPAQEVVPGKFMMKRHLHKPEDVSICLHSKGGDLEADVTAWKMAPSNQR